MFQNEKGKLVSTNVDDGTCTATTDTVSVVDWFHVILIPSITFWYYKNLAKNLFTFIVVGLFTFINVFMGFFFMLIPK